MTLLKSFGLSDIGVSRTNNEDAWVSLPEVGFFALADGMGGHQAGEVAAQETIEFLSTYASKIETSDPTELIIEMRHAIEKASRRIHQLGAKFAELQGMGTTLCCLMWREQTIVYAHVGDSRIYRYRKKKLELLTQDHSFLAKWLEFGKLAEECETPYPYKNVITRAIGGPGKANPEIVVAPHQMGDLYFLCSDGLSDVLSLEEMEQILNQFSDLAIAARQFIEVAKIKGSFDNMTILMVQSAAEQGSEKDGTDLPRQQRDNLPRSARAQSHADRLERAPS